MLKVNIRPTMCPALTALSVLSVHSGFDFAPALVGGAVRDAYHCITPNYIADQDVAIYGPEANEALAEIEVAMFKHGYTEKDRFSDEGEYAAGQIWLVIKYDHEVYPQVDLLFHPQASNIEDVLNTFDFNINKFAAFLPEPEVNEELDAYYYGETNHTAIAGDGGNLPQGNFFHEALPPEMPLRVLQPGVPVDKERTAKMVRLADFLGWSVPPRFRE